MRFTDWFLKQLCTHTHEITGWSAFSLYETRTFRTTTTDLLTLSGVN